MPIESGEQSTILFTQEGKLFRQTISHHELEVDEEAVFRHLRDGQKTKIPNAMMVSNIPVGLCYSSSGDAALADVTIPLKTVFLNTGYKLNGKKELIPLFNKPEPAIPSFALEWDMEIATGGELQLLMLVRIQNRNGQYTILKCFLMAASKTFKKFFRLPLPNVHSDCRICTGVFDMNHKTIQESAQSALEQFYKSSWNSDLMEHRESTEKFFRFEPKDNQFITLPVDGDAKKLCQTVAGIPELEFITPPPKE